MESMASQKRMVSSVFITLASPFRAAVTPVTHIHSSPARAPQQTAALLHRTSTSSCTSVGLQDGLTSVHNSPPATLSPLHAQSRSPATLTPYRLDNTDKHHIAKHSLDGNKTQGKNYLVNDSCNLLPVVTSYSSPPPPDLADFCAFPPPPHLHEPIGLHDPEPRPLDANAEVSSLMPSAGSKVNNPEELQGTDVCGFCRKPVLLSESAIDALNRSYHATCFQCRQCHAPLAAKLYYNKSGIPVCEDCYQARLEPCWACGDIIKDHLIRALERAYHPPCFVCTTCRQPIGEQRFAQGEVGEVYCLQDYYRKYAPRCSACSGLIIPRDDGTDSYTVECLGNSYHEDCYRCEVCKVLLSPEPNEKGCHPLEGQILCKACHYTLIQNTQH